MTKQTLTLRSFDVPQLHKFGIGFDNLFNDIERVMQIQNGSNYPPHNVIKTGDTTSIIEVAVAGFAEGEIDINLNKRQLSIAGERNRETEDSWEYLHRGISSRDFKLSFTLSEHWEVKDASITDGILRVNLEQEIPEEAKPKSIAITYNK